MEPPHIHIQGVDGEEIDSYTAAIELANTCREYYTNRLKIVQERKEKLFTSRIGKSPNRKHNISELLEHKGEYVKTSIDELMEKLKHEMASLMDQDLDLMKQLLMLNDQIEELKWRKRYSDKTPLISSCDLNNVATDYDTDNNTPVHSMSDLHDKYPSPSSLSLCKDDTPSTSREFLDDNAEKVKVTFQTPFCTKRESSDPGGAVGYNHKEHTPSPRQRSYHSAQQEPMRRDLSVQSAYTGAVTMINGSNDDEEAMKRMDQSEQQSFDSGFHEGDPEHAELALVQKRIATLHEQHRKLITGSHKVTTL